MHQPNDPVSVTLSAVQWNAVIEILHGAPYGVVAPIISAIASQGQQPAAAVVADERETKPIAVRVRKAKPKTNGTAPAVAEGVTSNG